MVPKLKVKVYVIFVFGPEQGLVQAAEVGPQGQVRSPGGLWAGVLIQQGQQQGDPS